MEKTETFPIPTRQTGNGNHILQVKKLSETIQLDDKKLILKKYKLRTAGNQGATIEITVPKAAVEREARRLGISEEEAVDKLLGVWRFNSFRGLHLDFERKELPK